MFCPKCGNQVPDGSGFCPACGQQLGGTVFSAPKKVVPFALPKAPQKFFMLYTLVTLIFSLCLEIFRMKETAPLGFTLSNGLMFKTFNACLGIAKIFVLINVAVFALYVVFSYIDINKTGIGTSSFEARNITALVYYIINLLVTLLSFIGILVGHTEKSAFGTIKTKLAPTSGFFIFLIMGVIGLLMVLFKKKLVKIFDSKY